MKAFDTDILTEILLGTETYVAKAAVIPPGEQAVPIVVVEELIRGRLNAVRQAEAGKGRLSVDRAYDLLQQTLWDLRQVVVLPYTSAAEKQFQQWRKQKIRGSTHDLRIAALCVACPATLVSRNRRDFEGLPGLDVEFWD